MSADPWRPPPVDEPSPWQREQVAAHLAASLPDLAARLNRLAGGSVVVEALTVDPAQPGADPIFSASPDLAAAMVAAVLGHSSPGSLDLAAPAEAAVLSLVLTAVREWAEACLPSGATADVCLAITARCLSACGVLEVPASWDALWAMAHPALPLPRRAIDVPVATALVAVEALLPGPDLTAADVLALKEGDLLLAPIGSNGGLLLQAGSVRLGTASLGAVSGHLAARVDEVSRRNPRDGSSE